MEFTEEFYNAQRVYTISLLARSYREAGLAACQMSDIARQLTNADAAEAGRLRGFRFLLFTAHVQIEDAYRSFKGQPRELRKALDLARSKVDHVEFEAPPGSDAAIMAAGVSSWLDKSGPSMRRQLRSWAMSLKPTLSLS